MGSTLYKVTIRSLTVAVGYLQLLDLVQHLTDLGQAGSTHLRQQLLFLRQPMREEQLLLVKRLPETDQSLQELCALVHPATDS